MLVKNILLLFCKDVTFSNMRRCQTMKERLFQLFDFLKWPCSLQRNEKLLWNSYWKYFELCMGFSDICCKIRGKYVRREMYLNDNVCYFVYISPFTVEYFLSFPMKKFFRKNFWLGRLMLFIHLFGAWLSAYHFLRENSLPQI